jgi:hypothetical protein
VVATSAVQGSLHPSAASSTACSALLLPLTSTPCPCSAPPPPARPCMTPACIWQDGSSSSSTSRGLPPLRPHAELQASHHPAPPSLLPCHTAHPNAECSMPAAVCRPHNVLHQVQCMQLCCTPVPAAVQVQRPGARRAYAVPGAMFFEARHIRPRGDITEHQCYMRCPQCRWSARRDLHASPTHGNGALLLETGSWSCKSTKMYIYENERQPRCSTRCRPAAPTYAAGSRQ